MSRNGRHRKWWSRLSCLQWLTLHDFTDHPMLLIDSVAICFWTGEACWCVGRQVYCSLFSTLSSWLTHFILWPRKPCWKAPEMKPESHRVNVSLCEHKQKAILEMPEQCWWRRLLFAIRIPKTIRTHTRFANVWRTLSTGQFVLLVSPAHPELKPSAKLEQVVANAQSDATQRGNARTFIGLQTQLGLHSEAHTVGLLGCKGVTLIQRPSVPF